MTNHKEFLKFVKNRDENLLSMKQVMEYDYYFPDRNDMLRTIYHDIKERELNTNVDDNIYPTKQDNKFVMNFNGDRFVVEIFETDDIIVVEYSRRAIYPETLYPISNLED